MKKILFSLLTSFLFLSSHAQTGIFNSVKTKALNLKGIASQNLVADSVLVVNAATGKVGYVNKSSIGSGGSPTNNYSNNVSEWLTFKSVNNPIINSNMFTPNPLVEHTQYCPSPIIAADSNVWVYVKGDGYNAVSVYKSLDEGESFTFVDSVVVPRAGTYYSGSATMPFALADSANNIIHLYFQAHIAGIYPNVFSIGKATAPMNNPSSVTISPKVLITPDDFKTQMGLAYKSGYLNISSIIKTDSIYYFGTYWEGNTDNPVGHFKIFMGSSNTFDTIYKCRQILDATGSFDLVQMPSIFYYNDRWNMIYTEGYIDNDSVAVLRSSYSFNLKTWNINSGTLLKSDNSSWDEKRVYTAKVLKKPSGNFGEPYYFTKKSYGYPISDKKSELIKYYYSGSSFHGVPYSDQSGLAYLAPQNADDKYYTTNTGNDVSIISRNTSHIINIPKADSIKTGKLSASDWIKFNSKAPGSGSSNYIQNNRVSNTPQSASFSIADSAHIGGTLMVGGNTNNLFALNINANAGNSNSAAMNLYNSGNFGKQFSWYIDKTTGEITSIGTGTSGSFSLSSFASGMLWQSAYWRWRENQYPFNYTLEIDGGSPNRIYAVPLGGNIGIGTYATDSTLTSTSAHFTKSIKVDDRLGVRTTPNSVLDVNGSFGANIKTYGEASDLTLDETDHTIILDGIISGSTITLPAASSCKRREYVIVNRDPSNDMNISLYYDFAGTKTKVPKGSSITLQSDNNVWYRIR